MELQRVTPVRLAVLFGICLAISWVSSLSHKVHADAPGVSLAGVNAGAQTFFFDTPASRFTTFQAGTQLTNPTSNTTFSDFYNIPANDPHLTQASAGFQVLATGNVTIAAAGTLTMSLNVNETNRVQAVLQSPGAVTNVPWLFRSRFAIQTPGSSATANGHCEFMLGTTSNNTASVAIGVIDPPFALDTTLATGNDVGVGVLFGTSNASNKIIMKHFQVSTIR